MRECVVGSGPHAGDQGSYCVGQDWSSRCGVSALLWAETETELKWMKVRAGQCSWLRSSQHSQSNGPAYRFAGSASLQRALRWGACRWASGLSASARSHSLLCKGTMWGEGINSYFLLRKRKVLKEKMHIKTHIYTYLGTVDFLKVKTFFYTFI